MTGSLRNNGSAPDCSLPAREQSVPEMLKEATAKFSDQIAVVCGQHELSYRELEIRSNQLGRFLKEQGVLPTHRVALCIEKSVEMVVAVLGILKSGAAYVPLDGNDPEDRLRFILKDTQASLILTDAAGQGRFSKMKVPVSPVDGQRNSIAEFDASEPPTLARPQDLAYVIYTSGSTGQPKGVMMAHAALANLLQWHRRSFSSPARTLQFAPLSFDVSFQEIFSTLDSGGTLVVLEAERRRDPAAIWDVILQKRIQRLFVPFIVLRQLAEAGAQACQLEDIITAGEQLRITPEIRQMFSELNSCRLHNHYGPSETHVVTAFTMKGAPEQWPALPPIGVPIDHVIVHVLDEEERPVDRGELCLEGKSLSAGYLNRPELTAQKFVTLSSGRRIYKTGDLVTVLPDGNLQFIGRTDDQLKIRGYRVEPGEIQTFLDHHQAVEESVVLAAETSEGSKYLMVYLVFKDPKAESALRALRSYLAENLPEYMIPSRIVPMDSLPLTASGKIDRQTLLASLATPPKQLSGEPSGDFAPTEKAVAAIWDKILGTKNLGPNDNFFQVGGHSIMLVKLQYEVTQQFKIRFGLRELLQNPTIKMLSELIEKRGQEFTK